MEDSTFQIKPVGDEKFTGWAIQADGIEDGTISNFVLMRPDGKFFHLTMVKASVTMKDGSTAQFWQPMLLEHSADKIDRVGDVVVVIRRHPQTKRFMVQVEDDIVYLSEEETFLTKRVKRSSADNVEQAIQSRVTFAGDIYLNSRRIGGLPVKTHGIIAPWSPQLAAEMMDIYEFVQGPDAPGVAALMKYLQTLGRDDPAMARAIFEQVHHRVVVV